MPTFTAGQCVSRDTRDGVDTIRVTSVTGSSLSYVCTDGHGDIIFASIFRTLDEMTADLRPATAEEAAAFEARYRRAPENWN
ncbi:hypothetical protein [Streptomyces sp. NRRL F-525]|uniref:hypothetical protein n=1 Tax=Streptomyces sp. NRRL F-525 TaxID=1463861 RepID=UPI000524F562|nr:hypothetical protein [Streptomyces sp. NRRL F-525]